MRFRKILALKLRSLGDTVLMTAPLLKLREAYPSAEIHAMATAPWCEVLERHPGIDRIIPYQRREEKMARAKNVARLAFQLRREKYDLVVNFHASPSSATLAFATGASTRSIHFHGHRDSNRYSTVEIPGKGEAKPIIERDLDTLRGLGLKIPPGSVLPQVFLSGEEISKMRSRFFPSIAKNPTLLLSFGASRPTKVWPLRKFAELATQWVRDTGGRVLAIRAPGEEELLQGFLGKIPRELLETSEISTLPELPVREIAAVLHLCSVFVGNDSGPKHLAVAVGAPTLTFIGPEDPQEWHPYSTDRHRFLHIPGLACRRDALPGMPPWCGLYECEVEAHRCMESISARDALVAAKELLP